MCQPATDQAGQRRAIFGDGDHLGSREEIGYRNSNVALELLPRQRLEQPCPQAAGRYNVDMPELLELVTGNVAADLWMAGPYYASKPLIEKVLHDEAVRRVDNPAKHQCGGARYDACFR